MSLYEEILEQPERIQGMLQVQRGLVEKIAAEIRARDVHYVFLAARGTSDNAARYANYIWGAHNHLPVALAAPSLFTYYRQPPHLRNALVVGISQSGQSPDIVSVLEEGRQQGNLTLAITNSPDSPLAAAADFVIDLMAGPERAVAATKTYTTQLMAIAMLSAALKQESDLWRELENVPAWVSQVFQQDAFIQQAVQRYRYMQHCVVLGRGCNYATAFEWALKLKELTYTLAEPYSSADFQHGPVAMITHGFPVLAIAARGKILQSVLESLQHLRQNLHAELVVISNTPETQHMAQFNLEMPVDLPEWLSPLVSIIPAQLFAYHLALARELNPEAPRSIQKVTETR